MWRLPVTKAGAPAGPPVQVTTGAGQDVQLAVSAAGHRLAFSVLRINADLWRLPVDPATGRPAGDPEPVVVTTREDSRGSWSPDGGQIAFNSDRSGDMNIWLHSVTDGTDRQLTRGPGGDYQPRWSPDGARLVTGRSLDPVRSLGARGRGYLARRATLILYAAPGARRFPSPPAVVFTVISALLHGPGAQLYGSREDRCANPSSSR